MKYFFIILFLAACTHETPKKDAPTVSALTTYWTATSRLLGMLDRGFVVSRWEDGTAEHKGDALIWSGVTLGTLPCERVPEIADALVKMVDDKAGGMYRHPDLPDQVSLDGQIGVYRGIAEVMARCPGEAERWAPILAKHLAPDSPAAWPLTEFRYVPELALAVATGAEHPDRRRLDSLLGAIEGWALGVQVGHQACFRVNLGYQTIKTVEALGEEIPAQRRENFCAVTRGMRLATVDHLCGRGDLAGWIDDFEFNRYEYAFQRCPWEGDPDGKPGLFTPAVDLLEAIRTRYSF
jgi:hypothetical protein